MASSRSSKSTKNSLNPRKTPSSIRWKQIFLGFLLGIFSTFAIEWFINNNQQAITGINLPSAGNEDNEINYDFFNVLPKQTVKVDTQELQEPSVEYFLQVGSYQNIKDAEAKRVELILLDVSAEIETANVNNIKVYRVVSGPYARKTLMSKARSHLIINGIKPLLLKRDIKK